MDLFWTLYWHLSAPLSGMCIRPLISISLLSSLNGLTLWLDVDPGVSMVVILGYSFWTPIHDDLELTALVTFGGFDHFRDIRISHISDALE